MIYNSSTEMDKNNNMFICLVNLGMTKEDLEANINRRPWIWKIYEKWLDVLPTEKEKYRSNDY